MMKKVKNDGNCWKMMEISGKWLKLMENDENG